MHRTLFCLLIALGAGNSPAAELPELLVRARSLAWTKRFSEAAALYTEVLRQSPDLREARLGLARVRLWQGRYREARTAFLQLVAANRRDGEAAEAAATAAYWSGDYRTAEREFRAVLQIDPTRSVARESLGEIHAASSPVETFDTTAVDDDQPFRSVRSLVRLSVFTDPLTRWDVSAGASLLHSEVGGLRFVPTLSVRNETVFPALHLTITPSLGTIRMRNGRFRTTGGTAVRVQMPRHQVLIASVDRHEILTHATTGDPFVDVVSLRWRHEQAWLASAGFERDRFSDRNRALAADAYLLWPVAKRGSWTLAAGASGLWRDTEESRFSVSAISARRDPSGSFFHYSYRGSYDPYWTPRDLGEGRILLSVDGRIRAATTLRIQGDAGRARDLASAFFPASGTTSFPGTVSEIFFRRSYHPWRLGVSAAVAVRPGLTVDLGYEHSVLSDYRANTFHASLARRR